MKGVDFQESGDQLLVDWCGESGFGVLLDMIVFDKGRTSVESGMGGGELTLECVYE